MMRPGWSVKKLKPNPVSVAARLPKFYTDFMKELQKEPAPVHYIPEQGKYKPHEETKERTLVENIPLPLKFPKQADEGIWGGEGVIQGFTKFIPTYRGRPKFWIPSLKRSVVYSEILNKYMSITVTERTLQLIDKHYGFDNYILETPVQDLKSQLALDLRRKMLLTLIDKEKCYDDPSEQEKIWAKYQKFKIPREDAVWFGLSMKEAIKKQRLIEEEEMKPLPLKLRYREAYFEQLKENAKNVETSEQKVKSFISKVKFWDTPKKKDES